MSRHATPKIYMLPAIALAKMSGTLVALLGERQEHMVLLSKHGLATMPLLVYLLGVGRKEL